MSDTPEAALYASAIALVGMVGTWVRSAIKDREQASSSERRKHDAEAAEAERTRLMVEKLLRERGDDCEERVSRVESLLAASQVESGKRAERLAKLEAEHAYCPARIEALEKRLARYDGQRTPTTEEWAAARDADPETWGALRRPTQ